MGWKKTAGKKKYVRKKQNKLIPSKNWLGDKIHKYRTTYLITTGN